MFILVEDQAKVLETENLDEALGEFITSTERVHAMDGDIEASLTVTWVDD